MAEGGGTGITIEMHCKHVQEQNLERLARNGAFQFSDTFFPYTSGEIGNYYVQSAEVTKNGEDYRNAIKDMRELISIAESAHEIGAISGGESRDWIFSYPVAVELETPHFAIYKDGKTLGADIKGKRVVHVADLNNEGSSPRDLWVPAIQKQGGIIERIFFYVDRLEDGVKVMSQIGLESYSIVPLNKHAWDYLAKQQVISQEVYGSLMERWENKGEWARKMLRSDAGLKTLAKLLRDSKTVEKGKKILEKGYPDMKAELLERLKTSENLTITN
jgi:orotate phosphoribosyltransferase